METIISLFVTRNFLYSVSTVEDAAMARLLGLLTARVASAAFQHFADRHFLEFDALVGETSCQLRAMKQQQIADDYNHNRQRLEELAQQFQVIANRILADLAEQPKKPESKTTIAHYLERLAGDAGDPSLRLDFDEQFIFLSHFLTLTRDRSNRMKTCSENLEEFLPQEQKEQIPRFFGKDLDKVVFQAKKTLAERSVTALDMVASHLKEDRVLLTTMVKQKIIGSHDIPCSPCFFTIRVLLQSLKETGRPLILKVVPSNPASKLLPVKVVFAYDEQGKLRQLDQTDICSSRAAIVFEGQSAELFQDGNLPKGLLGEKDEIPHFPHSRLMEVILCDAAMHPQFAGGNHIGEIPEIFNRSSVKVILKRIKQDGWTQESLDRVLKNLTKKERNIANNDCRGKVGIREVATSYLHFRQLRERAVSEKLMKTDAPLFSINHIYCNSIADELKKEMKNDNSA